MVNGSDHVSLEARRRYDCRYTKEYREYVNQTGWDCAIQALKLESDYPTSERRSAADADISTRLGDAMFAHHSGSGSYSSEPRVWRNSASIFRCCLADSMP